MRVDVWSDLVCPWCYVGKRRFERALASFPHRGAVDVVHRAYLLYAASPRGVTFDRRDMLMTKYRLSAVSGAQPSDVLVEALSRAWANARAQSVTT